MSDFIIRNFQSIEEAKLSVQGLTLIIGESGAGKSSVFKAIQAATTNRFRSNQIKYGEAASEIKVRHNKDVLVVRKEPTGSPVMKLGDLVFSKLNRTLPEKVEEFNNYGNLELGDIRYSLNFHEQFQKPILLEFSQKKVMEILSSSKGMEDYTVVYKELSKRREQNRGAFKSVDAMLSSSNAELSDVKSRISLIEPYIKNLQDLQSSVLENSKRLTLLQNLTKLFNHFKQLSSKLNLLKELYNSLSNINSLKPRLEITKSSQNLRIKLNHCISIQSSLTRLKDLYHDCSQSVNSLSLIQSVLSLKAKHHTTVVLFNKLTKLQNILNSQSNLILKLDTVYLIQSVLTKLNSLDTKPLKQKVTLLSEALNCDSKLKSCKQKLSFVNNVHILETQLNNLMATKVQYEDIVNNKVCPICKSKITSNYGI